MNAPTKLLKPNSGPSQQTCTVNQRLSKKYYKIYKKQKPINQKEDTNTISRRESISSVNENKIQDEVLKWFFSLEFSKRVKVSSIQNKVLSNILHQMYAHSILDSKVKFQHKQNVFPDEIEGDFYPLVYNNKSNQVQFVNVNVNNLGNLYKNGENVNHYLNYFNANTQVQTNININNYLKNHENMERDFLTEVKFYKCEEQNDIMLLSSNLLTNEENFRKFFSYFSNDKFFNKTIHSSYEPTNKIYLLNLPEWVNTKDHYSFCQFLVAFFEQVILIWFYFSKNLDQSSFDSLITSTNYDTKINDILEDSEKIVKFLKKILTSNPERRKLFDELNVKSISIKIRNDQTVSELIQIKRKIQENVYKHLFNNIYYAHNHERRSLSEILSEIECQLRTHLYQYNEEKFVEHLLFTTFEKIFTYTDFFLKRVYDEIHNIYTRQNALDLMNEVINFDEIQSSEIKKSFGSQTEINKRKKNLKKNKKVKRYEKDESPSSSTERSSPKNMSPNLNTRINLKTKKEDELQLEENSFVNNSISCVIKSDSDSTNEIYVKSLVNNLIINAIENVEILNEKLSDCKIDSKISSNDFNDTDTAYSSSNFSDGIKIRNNFNKVKNVKKKEKNNNFFLYTINPAHQKINSRKNSKAQEMEKISNKLASPVKELIYNKDKEKDATKNLKEINQKFNHKLNETLIEKINEKENNSILANSVIQEKENENNKSKKENLIIIENKIPYSNPISNNENIQQKLNEKLKEKENLTIENSNYNIENNNINITINSPVYNNFYIINNSPNNNNFNANSINSRMMIPNNNYYQKPNYMYKSQFTNPINYNPNKHFMQEDFLYYQKANNFFNPYYPQFDNYNKMVQYNNLHTDIVNYSTEVNENVMLLKVMKIAIIKKLEEMIKDSLNEYDISLNLFGSFATDLEIESSDIDITVRYQNKIVDIKNNLQSQSYVVCNYSTDLIINRLVKTFTQKNLFDFVTPIYTASVPVIKLQLDLHSLLDGKELEYLTTFKHSDNYNIYKFNKEELDKIRIDLTFMDTNKSNINLSNKLNTFESPSQQAVEYVKNSLLCFPEIKPLIHVLKRFLQLEKMNSTFNGGLSSFSLFLTIFAFLKMRKLNTNFYNSQNNLGSLLIEYLEFYANFNFNCNFIDVNSTNPFILSNEIIEQIPLILDPTTYLNTGKSSYKIEEVKQSFLKGCNYFNSQLYTYEKNCNQIYSLFKLITK